MHHTDASTFAAHAVISRAALADAVARVAKVVDKRVSVPVLGNVRLMGDGAGLSMIATDLDRWHKITIPGAADSRFDITVPAHTFRDILKKQEGEHVAASHGDDGVLRLDFEGPSIRLNALAPDEFPGVPDKDFAHSFQISALDLYDVLDSTRFAVSTEETRYYLNGVYMHASKDDFGNGELRFVATDGHRLACANITAPDGVDAMPGVIIPRLAVDSMLAELSALLAAHKKAKTEAPAICVAVSGTMIRFTFGDSEFTSKLVDGTFPDYGRVIPRPVNMDKSAEFSTKAAIKAIAAVTCIASERGRAVKVAFDGTGTMKFVVNNPDIGEAIQSIPLHTYDTGEFEIGFNSAYLAACLKESRVEEITLRMSDSGSPARMDSSFGNVRWTVVLMPMRV